MASEPTDQGDQHLLEGIKSITQADRLRVLADAPLLPKRAQRACNIGLFDEHARNQLDLFVDGGKP